MGICIGFMVFLARLDRMGWESFGSVPWGPYTTGRIDGHKGFGCRLSF